MEKKRGRGRPAKSDDERRDVNLNIRLNRVESQLIDAAAKGEDVSTWAREKLVSFARKQNKAKTSLK